jgi:hypothetical protein
MATENQYAMQDPTKQYPRPPFPKQPQPVPGLAQKMDPKPDHGEDSYRGFGHLAGRRALITGADSGIGRAAAIAFAREGADIALNYLPSEEADAREVVVLIEAAGRKAVCLPGSIADEGFCKSLVSKAHEALGGLDHAAIRRDLQDQRLQHVLAMQGGAAAAAARCHHHQHRLDPVLSTVCVAA